MLETISVYPDRQSIERAVLAADPVRSDEPRVSIYLPRQSLSVSPALRKVKMIRLIKQAERLIAKDHGVDRARELMRSFWKCEPLQLVERSGLALALFHDSEFTGAMNLGVDVEEKVIVATSFHIKPLLGWLQAAPQFWLISLSSQRVKLYEGNPWELRIREVIQAPVHGGDDRRNPRASADKESVRQFFLKAESVLHPILNRDRHPVVIAGVSWLHPIYRKVNRDPDLVSHAIQGNVEKWAEEDLRSATLDVLSKLLDQAKTDAVREFERLAWKGEASDDLAQVARAAIRGKVRKILLASDLTLWGRLNPESGTITLHPEQLDSRDDDVLDDLAEAVLARGGKVLCVPSRELPTDSPVAALMK